MDTFELKHLQNVLLIIMDEVHRICIKHNIRYTLWAGSMIGAVRHGGFIPWDDDLDIAMLRADYERFIEICKVELADNFDLVSIDTDDVYGYGFCKIVLLGTNVEQLHVKNGKNLKIWLDIFPYDNIPNDKKKQSFQEYTNYVVMKILEERFDGVGSNPSISKKICFGIAHMINWCVSAKFLKNVLTKNMKNYMDSDGDFCSSISSPYGYKREIIKRNMFDSIKLYKFEEKEYYGFIDYDEYLTNVYGDYMKIPPEEKRHVHNLIVHDFERY